MGKLFDFLFKPSKMNNSTEADNNSVEQLLSNPATELNFTMSRTEFITFLKNHFKGVEVSEYNKSSIEINFKEELDTGKPDALIIIRILGCSLDIENFLKYIESKVVFDENDNKVAEVLSDSNDYLEFLVTPKGFEKHGARWHVYTCVLGNIEVTIWGSIELYQKVYSLAYEAFKDFNEVVNNKI